jgi:adenylate kinase
MPRAEGLFGPVRPRELVRQRRDLLDTAGSIRIPASYVATLPRRNH